jgi:hypothetical protein
MIKKKGIETDLVDISALWDSSLTYGENKAVIGQFCDTFGKKEEKPSKQVAEEKEHYESIMREKEIKVRKEEIQKEYEKILKSETSNLRKYYFVLERFVETILEAKYNHSLFLTGRAGLGKSYTVMKTLNKEKNKKKMDYKLILGNITPLELYHNLYQYRTSILVFDDTQALLKNKQSMSLLLSAMWTANPDNIRNVNWLSSSQKLKAPQNFDFEGKIIFIANEIPKDVEPVVSRCMDYELVLSYADILLIMTEIAKMPHKVLTKEQRLEVLNWIKENTDETVENFDLRLQSKLETLYEYNKENWKDMAKHLIRRDSDVEIIKQLIAEFRTTKTAVKEYVERTGCSRRKFFYIKKRIESSMELMTR